VGRCGADAPVHRYEASTLRMLGWAPYTTATVVNWCGHGQEFILWPEEGTAGWFREVPVLGEAS